MSFERSNGRRLRLRTTLAVLGLVGSSLALSLPARAEYADPNDKTPTENYVPKAGYVYDAPRTPGRLTPATGALFGTHSDEITKVCEPAPTPKDPNHCKNRDATSAEQSISKLEKDLGRTLDIDNHYTSNFDDWLRLKQAGQPVQLEIQEQFDLQANRIPLVGWACGDSTDITDGKLDAAIHAAGEAFKAFPREFFMRYCWEMDGSRQSKRIPVGPPKDFIAAWRYIYNMLKADGVTNVIWVWTANANGYKAGDSITGGKPPAPFYYPGDDYVDWVSSDGYNWHGASGRAGEDRYRDFLEIYDQFMLWARTDDPTTGHVGSSKPIMVAEYGTQEQNDGGKLKAAWLKKAHETVMPRPAGLDPNVDKWKGAYSDVQAMVYYDVAGKSADSEGGWTVYTSPAALAQYKADANLGWFNQIKTLTWGPYTGQGDDPGTTPTTDPTTPTTGPVVVEQVPKGRNGYRMLGADGKVYAFGDAKHLGAPNIPAGASAADLESTPSGNGYWIVDTLGNVSAYGDATGMGGIATGQLSPGETVTSLSATPSGKGYWIFTTKGRAIRFGDATFFGDMSRQVLAGPVLDSIPTRTGNGYYMVASDGGIFAFGDAQYFGSMGGKKLNKPVQSLVPDPDGVGYWLVASDGGIFAFQADFRGSMGGKPLAKPVTGMVPYGNGYMMVAEDGGIFNFSSSQFLGSLGAAAPSRPVVSVAAL